MADHGAEYRVSPIPASAGPVVGKAVGSQISVSCVLANVDPALFCEPNSALRIAPQSVHVWSFSLEAAERCREACSATLCATERARAERFVDERNRNEFIVAHGVLRFILARYTGIDAHKLRFALGKSGKPALAGEPWNSTVSFNLTHSHGRALAAISDGRDLGIDLEQLNPAVKTVAIAQRYFSDSEFAEIQSTATPVRARAFFRYWVAKEAVLKGQGIGLKFPIDGFEVEFDAAHTQARIRTPRDSRLADDWRIRMLPLEQGWIGALAVRGDDWSLSLQSLTAAPPARP